jgi:RNA polymerase sigma factor (sigma-70 family)
MARQFESVLRHIRHWVNRDAAEDGSDGQLLERFVRQRDEAAFEALVRRHSSLVWGVCRRVLGDAHDAEDAFQATFLILFRKAGSLGQPATVAGWLYTVACHVSLRARAVAGRRRECERQAMKMSEATTTADEPDWGDLQPVLDEVLSQLPAKYREPIVLCYLKGKTEQETARLLGCPTGTVSWRLVRARELLRDRLTRRGLALSTSLLGMLLTENAASAAAPASLVNTTLTITQLMMTTGKASSAVVASAQVSALTEGVLKAMWLTKLKTVAAIVIVALGLAGSGLFVHQVLAEKPPAVAQGAEDSPHPNPPPQGGRETDAAVVRTTKDLLTPESMASLQQLLRPDKSEYRWDEIPWLASIWHARKKAAAENKPIFVFGTAGAGFNDPLGNC